MYYSLNFPLRHSAQLLSALLPYLFVLVLGGMWGIYYVSSTDTVVLISSTWCTEACCSFTQYQITAKLKALYSIPFPKVDGMESGLSVEKLMAFFPCHSLELI